MRRIGAEAPAIGFQDFETYLDDYIAALPSRDPAAVEEDLTWFRAYYFDHNDDARRLRVLERFIEEAKRGR
jgi:hypothetical protein